MKKITYDIPYIIMMNSDLETLNKREQLMEDIDCIIEANFGEVEYKDDVIRQLCDAVCRNFPVQNTSP
jgi:flagellar biosynthesis/type III secretory pathway protein FliH